MLQAGKNILVFLIFFIVSNKVCGRSFILTQNDFARNGFYRHTDLFRVYSSKSSVKGIFGSGWSSILDTKIVILSDAITYSIFNGEYGIAKKVNSQNFKSNNIDIRFEENEYFLTSPHLIYEFIFDKDGKLKSISNRESKRTYSIQRSGEDFNLRDINNNLIQFHLEHGLVRRIKAEDGTEILYDYSYSSLTQALSTKSKLKFIYDDYNNLSWYKIDDVEFEVKYKDITGEYVVSNFLGPDKDKSSAELIKDQTDQIIMVKVNDLKIVAQLFYDRKKRIENIVLKNIDSEQESSRVKFSYNVYGELAGLAVMGIGEIVLKNGRKIYFPNERKMQLKEVFVTMTDVLRAI